MGVICYKSKKNTNLELRMTTVRENIKIVNFFMQSSFKISFIVSLLQQLALSNSYKLCIILASYYYYNKLPQINNLKQHTFSGLQFWRSKIWHGSHLAKIKLWTGLYFLLEVLGENSFPCLFQILEATHILWLMAPFTFETSNLNHLHLLLTIDGRVSLILRNHVISSSPFK